MTDTGNVSAHWPRRQIDDGDWEVLVVPEDKWIPCASEEEARILARAPVLRDESLQRSRSGSAFAQELEELADVLETHGMGAGSRFFRQRASEVRAANQ
jgi:hypothetical protein